MTTIAYSFEEGRISYDSRASGGTYIYNDDMDKSIKRGQYTFVLAGDCKDRETIVDAYLSVDKAIGDEICVSCLVIDHKAKEVFNLLNIDEKIHEDLMDHDMTIGSGGMYAMAALDLGCSTKDAVKAAMKRDTATGGKIRSTKV